MLKFTSCLILMGCGTLATAADGDFVLDNDGRRYELLPLRQIAIERPANYFYLQMSEDDTLCETVLASYNTAYSDKEPVIQPMLDTYSRNLFHTDISVAWSEKIRPSGDSRFDRGLRYQFVDVDIDNNGEKETIVRFLSATPYISENRIFYDADTLNEKIHVFQWKDPSELLVDIFFSSDKDIMQKINYKTVTELQRLGGSGPGFAGDKWQYNSQTDVFFEDVIRIGDKNYLSLLNAGIDVYVMNLFILELESPEEASIRCQFRGGYILR